MGLHDLVGAARREVEVLVCLACLVAIVSPGLLALDCALASLRRRRANAILILGEEAITLRLRLRERPALALARAVALACDEGEAGDEMRAMGSYTGASKEKGRRAWLTSARHGASAAGFFVAGLMTTPVCVIKTSCLCM